MFLRHVHPPVSCQWLIVLVQAAVFAAPLCSQACCISHSAHSLVTHASLLPLAHPPVPPRLYTTTTLYIARLRNTRGSCD
jgi:hypothetical protein